MRTERFSSLRADLALLGITAIWGATFPAMQLALRDGVLPLTLVAARFGIAAALLAAIFRRRAVRTSLRGLGAAILLGLCLASGSVLQTIGLRHTTASKSAFITALYVIIVPLVALLVARVRLRASSLVAVVLAAAGLYLLTMPSVKGLNIGDMLTLGCAVAFALHILIAESAAPRHDPVALTFWQVATTAATCGMAMAIVQGPRFPITPWTVSALLLTGVLATALAFAVQMWAQRETSATHAAVIFTGEPVFAAIFAGLIQGEWLSRIGMGGGLLIVGAMLLAQVGARPARAGNVERPRQGHSGRLSSG